MGFQDVRSCVEQLQTIEKEVALLEASKKGLADFKDQLTEKKGEVNELLLKREVLGTLLFRVKC